jgi:hypothetical protein
MVRGLAGILSSNICGETSTRLVPGKGPLTDWTAAGALPGDAGCAAGLVSFAWAMRRFSRALWWPGSRRVASSSALAAFSFAPLGRYA